MEKKGQTNLWLILAVFIGVIFGIAMLSQIIDTQYQVTNKQTATNESISVVTSFLEDHEVNESINNTIYSQSDWKKIECPLTSVTLRNGAGTELTADTDYILYANDGVFSLLNTTDTSPATSLNLTYVDYTFCADGYNTNSSSRGIARLWSLFAALIILGAAVFGIREWLNR